MRANKIFQLAYLITISIFLLQSCKKVNTPPIDFIKYTATDNECRFIGTVDSNAWKDEVLKLKDDTAFLIFSDNIYFSDSVTAEVHISAPCPNPSNGFFFWNISTSRECKLKLACVDTAYNLLYYNAYKLQGGPIDIGFDFRSVTAFHKNNYYKMYFAFYTSRDSIFYSGYGNFKVE